MSGVIATRDQINHAEVARALAAWYPSIARELPWRRPAKKSRAGARRDAWRSLVSEFMLQQTQVSRVLEKFEPFIERFPTPVALAEADEHDVMAMWSGLGYYRRARLLHAAAKAIAATHEGVVPAHVDALMTLPGVGRYTAGAVASIVYGHATPIVDGNVSRVLLRLSAKRSSAADAADWAWDQAGHLVESAVSAGVDVGVMNEGLMELGATICTPKAARCDSCPLGGVCGALRSGTVNDIPTPKTGAKRKAITADVVVVVRGGRVLVRQRPARGLWARMWEAPTLEREGMPEQHQTQPVVDDLGLRCDLPARAHSEFLHRTTHRDVYFRVWRARNAVVRAGIGEPGRWVSAGEVDTLGLSNPQAGILRAALGAG